MQNQLDFTRENKSNALTSAASWQNPGNGLGLYFADKRPQSVIQKKQVEAMSAKQALNAIIQKKANNPVLSNKQPIQMAGGSWKSWAATAAAGLGAAALITGAAPITGAVGLAGGLGYLGYTAYRRYQRGPAEDIRRRAGERGAVRKANNRFPPGQYDAETGPVGVSGMNRQRIAQTNMNNYNGETMGSIPPYSTMQAEMAPEDVAFIHDPAARRSPGMPNRRRIAAGVAMTASNVSEEDKAPGIGKDIRASARRFTAEGGPHPLSPALNPAVRSAPEARSYMAGGAISPQKRYDLENYASDSSDAGDDNYATRTGILKPRK